MDCEIKIISKYLIEKASILFTRKKQILSICTDRIVLQSTHSDLRQSVDLDNLDKILYEDFREIKVNDKNETDFTIIADKKYDFMCVYRNRLICELKHEISLYLE